MRFRLLIVIVIISLVTGCSLNFDGNDQALKQWRLMEESAADTIVTIALDHSDAQVLEWLKDTYASYLKTNYNMTLKVVEQPIAKTFDGLKQDKLGEVDPGQIDIILFENASDFKNAYQAGYLYGPFTDKLPEIGTDVDSNDLNFRYRAGIATQGYNIPYGVKQLSFIYNEDVFYDKPETYEALIETIKSYKGQFTYPNPKSSAEGAAFVAGFVAQNVDLEPYLVGNFDKTKFKQVITPGLNTLKALSTYLYNGGVSYPATVSELDDLFNNGALMMSFSLDYNYATDRLKEYEYPENASTFVIPSGVATYVESASIAYNSPNKSGAIVALNALLSPEMQASKLNPKDWGSLSIYTSDFTPKESLDQLKAIKLKSTTVKYDDFMTAQMPEFTPEMMSVLIEAWQTIVMNGQ
ncbi:MAG: hypothetical protein BGO41_08780 [Clostridiales bacterium 38-18]|nr:MAG: hypothetical protein BGO41_08780 [Clostridiales bacterium 38-18]